MFAIILLGGLPLQIHIRACFFIRNNSNKSNENFVPAVTGFFISNNTNDSNNCNKTPTVTSFFIRNNSNKSNKVRDRKNGKNSNKFLYQ